jgi:hypothetical protein
MFYVYRGCVVKRIMESGHSSVYALSVVDRHYCAMDFFDYMMRIKNRVSIGLVESSFFRIFLKFLFYFGRLSDQEGEGIFG